MANSTYTVANYLADRLSQLGVQKIFGVPGNHLGPCLSIIKEDSDIQWVGMTNEINAGFAADGYARCKGLGVVGVTYGVGAFSLINTIGGASVERVPLVVINASPTNEQWLNYQALGLLTSHMSQNSESNLNAYRQVTASAQVVTNANLAPKQIDNALEICLTEKRPVYLEVRENVFISPCHQPVGPLAPRPRPTTQRNKQILAQAIDAAAQKVQQTLQAQQSVVLWGGVEIERFDLEKTLLELAETTRFPIFTTIMGKGIISEYHPLWHGVYNGSASLPKVREAFDSAGCKIGLGAWTTSKNLGGTQALGEEWIKADHEGVSVGSRYFPEVKLGEFMDGLREALNEVIESHQPKIVSDIYSLLSSSGDRRFGWAGSDLAAFGESFLAPSNEAAGEWSYDQVILCVNSFLESEQQKNQRYDVVADAGFSLLSAQNLRLRNAHSFHSQTSWLSIGYSVPAAIGIKEASRDTETPSRVLVFIGDGAFQETCQALSDHTRLNHNSVVFIFNNQDFYGIEQMLVDASFFKEGSHQTPDHYNLLHPWNYADLHRVFASDQTPIRGRVVNNRDDFLATLEIIGNDEESAGPMIVQINVPQKSYPAAIAYKVEAS